jgi:hypothetical protein
MSAPRKIHIFHLYRKGGDSLFLHPFESKKQLIPTLEQATIVGHYGEEPRVESLTLFRNELYRMIETEVKNWVADAKFIPRFLMSSGIFLVTYMFLSFVVRDPLPMLDEIAISLALSVGAYVLLGRRDLQSEQALKKRIALRTKVDGIVFTESQFVHALEELLQAKEGESPEHLLRSLAQVEDLTVSEEDEEMAQQALEYLEAKFKEGDFKKTEKRIRRLEANTQDGRDVQSLAKWVDSKHVDAPLFFLYLQLKRKIKA